jgi:broad specificity phosphatase PhoE
MVVKLKLEKGKNMVSNRRNMEKWKNLFLVRHGESTCNEVNRFAGSIDAPLTSLGEAQATRAAKNWQGQLPDRIYTSPLQRAKRTAEILFPAAFNFVDNEEKLVIDKRISERHFGDFTLQNKAFIQRDVGLRDYEMSLYGDCAAMRGGEDFMEFQNRVLEFLRDEIHPLLLEGKRILVVAHKYVIEMLCSMILRLSSQSGHDLRLPNAMILAGDKLRSYVSGESRAANLVRDWIVLNYSQVLLFGVVIGLLLRQASFLENIPPLVPLLILSLATGISMARVDLGSLKPFSLQYIPFKILMVRYVLFPLSVGALGFWASQNTEIYFLAILLAAPSAITGITISRYMGGIVLPTVYIILFSSIVSTLVILPLLGFQGVESMAGPILWLFIILIVGLVIPFMAVRTLRFRFPIGTAKFAENNAATSVILLTFFVVLSLSSVNLGSFWPAGVWAFAFAIILRILALILSRHGSLFAIDDYISFSFPNIFFVVILTSILGLSELKTMAAWFLLPMFALAPIDEMLCRRIVYPNKDSRLLSFLKIEKDIENVFLKEVLKDTGT